MQVIPTPLSPAYIIIPDHISDDRGFFSRLFCQHEFAQFNINPNIAQINNSYNHKKGTLRGLHYQKEPFEEEKTVRVVSGAIWDVIVDIRPSSPTYLSWFGAGLDAENRKMMFVPKGFAHGFITLTDNTEVFYFMSQSYSPDHSSGLPWNDPALSIDWPIEPVMISEKDMNWPTISS